MGMKRLGWNNILANGVGNGTGWNPVDDKTCEEMIEMKYHGWIGKDVKLRILHTRMKRWGWKWYVPYKVLLFNL